MKTHPHRAVDLPASPPSRRAGQCRFAVLAGVLAALMLSTTTAVAAPTFSPPKTEQGTPPGIIKTLMPGDYFDNAGTNARFTSVTFSTTEYYDAQITGLNSRGFIHVKVKTNAELNALASPPSNPFTVTAAVTMTNDESETASGTISLDTTWAKKVAPAGPTLSVTTVNSPPDVSASGYASYFFSNAGAGARLTDVSFSTMDYYNADRTGLFGPYLDVTPKTSEELNAMDSPPPNPFTVDVTLTMTNNAGQTGTGTVRYTTSY